MADEERLDPESAVKFFVGVSTAGIGFIVAGATFLQQHGFFQQPKSSQDGQLVLMGFASLICFAVSIFAGAAFYVDGMGKNLMGRAGAKERLYKTAQLCALSGVYGLFLLDFAGLLVLGGWLFLYYLTKATVGGLIIGGIAVAVVIMLKRARW